jgi:hypothetical protein
MIRPQVSLGVVVDLTAAALLVRMILVHHHRVIPAVHPVIPVGVVEINLLIAKKET